MLKSTIHELRTSAVPASGIFFRTQPASLAAIGAVNHAARAKLASTASTFGVPGANKISEASATGGPGCTSMPYFRSNLSACDFPSVRPPQINWSHAQHHGKIEEPPEASERSSHQHSSIPSSCSIGASARLRVPPESFVKWPPITDRLSFLQPSGHGAHNRI